MSTVVRPPPPATLDLYRPALDRWMPRADLRASIDPVAHFDGLLVVRMQGKVIHYYVEEKRHLRHLDAAVVAGQLARRRAALPPKKAWTRILLLAPHVRDEQADILERAGIDYLDLAGNAHLDAPGLFVHVQGRRPARDRAAATVRPHKGWIKTVMTFLVQPDLVRAPYRVVANEADVSLGTVAMCLDDLKRRGLLIAGSGDRTLPDRQRLVALWVQAYVEALRPKLAERRFQVRVEDKPQMWDRLQTVLGERRQRWAVTGADAAALRDRYFRTTETEIYAPIGVLDDREVQKALLAQPAARSGNLIVIEPPGPLAVPQLADTVVPTAPEVLQYAELRYRGTEQAMEAADVLLPRLLNDATA